MGRERSWDRGPRAEQSSHACPYPPDGSARPSEQPLRPLELAGQDRQSEWKDDDAGARNRDHEERHAEHEDAESSQGDADPAHPESGGSPGLGARDLHRRFIGTAPSSMTAPRFRHDPASTRTSLEARPFRSARRMPRSLRKPSTIEKAKRDLAQGKEPSTAAGEFVREEIEHIREGRHGARSPKQAIAIGLSKARRAGVPLKPPRPGSAKRSTRRSAAQAYAVGQGRRKPRAPSPRRARATEKALQREPRESASRNALSAQASQAARRRSASERSQAAKTAVATKEPKVRSRAAKRAALTRQRHR